MTLPKFNAEASLEGTVGYYRVARGLPRAYRSKVLPQQIGGIPPGLECLINYWACNSSCASVPIWRRAQCYSYCHYFYTRCLMPVPVPG
jgi:hypothetical protein